MDEALQVADGTVDAVMDAMLACFKRMIADPAVATLFAEPVARLHYELIKGAADAFASEKTGITIV